MKKIKLLIMMFGIVPASFSTIVHTTLDETATSDNTAVDIDLNGDGIIDTKIEFNDLDFAFQFNVQDITNPAQYICTIETDETYGGDS